MNVSGSSSSPKPSQVFSPDEETLDQMEDPANITHIPIVHVEPEAIPVPDLQLRNEEIAALNEELQKRKIRQRRFAITTFLVLAMISLIVGGICGSGKCSTTQTSPIPGPTGVPSASPSYSPTLPPAVVQARSDEILAKLRSISFSSAAIEFSTNRTIENGNQPSPVELAIEWLIDVDEMRVEASDVQRLVQRYVLALVFFQMGEPLRSDQTDDRSSWLANVDECAWVDVSCLNGTITSLQLEDGGLQGEIPEDIGLLTELTLLSMFRNNIAGTLPTSVGNLGNLILFAASFNRLTGTIPSELELLTSLQYLDLQRNALIDSVPEFFAELTNLALLGLGENLLSSTIPTRYSALTNLVQLTLNNNIVTGSIPSSLSSLTNLELLNLFDNR